MGGQSTLYLCAVVPLVGTQITRALAAQLVWVIAVPHLSAMTAASTSFLQEVKLTVLKYKQVLGEGIIHVYQDFLKYKLTSAMKMETIRCSVHFALR